MNPLAKHPILQFLPYDIKKQPSFKSIHVWLKKKIKTFKIFRLITIIAFILFIVNYLVFNDVNVSFRGLDILNNIFDIALPLSLLVLTIIFHNLIKKYKLSDEEINNELQKYEQYVKNTD